MVKKVKFSVVSLGLMHNWDALVGEKSRYAIKNPQFSFFSCAANMRCQTIKYLGIIIKVIFRVVSEASLLDAESSLSLNVAVEDNPKWQVHESLRNTNSTETSVFNVFQKVQFSTLKNLNKFITYRIYEYDRKPRLKMFFETYCLYFFVLSLVF